MRKTSRRVGWLRSDAQLLCFLPKLGIQTCKAATIIADGGPRLKVTSVAAAKGNRQGHIHYLTIFSKIQLVVYYQCCVLIG